MIEMLTVKLLVSEGLPESEISTNSCMKLSLRSVNAEFKKITPFSPSMRKRLKLSPRRLNLRTALYPLSLSDALTRHISLPTGKL